MKEKYSLMVVMMKFYAYDCMSGFNYFHSCFVLEGPVLESRLGIFRESHQASVGINLYFI
jgi:hypothetical protein